MYDSILGLSHIHSYVIYYYFQLYVHYLLNLHIILKVKHICSFNIQDIAVSYIFNLHLFMF